MNFSILFRLVGIFLALFTLSLSVGIPVALIYGEWSVIPVFLESLLVGGIISGSLYFLGRHSKGDDVYRREALATVGISWLLAAAIGALPFFLSGAVPDYASAYFESASGLTTTGASVFRVIENKSLAILFWRSFLHFLGGLGIVVLFVAFLPTMGVGGRALFKQESTGPVTEGMTPRIKDTAMKLVKVYIGLNVIQTVLLMICGMSLYEALIHAMGTIATGGFSTRNASIAAFTSPAIEWIIIGFMYLAGVNFGLHVELVRGRFAYLKSTEFRVYTSIVLGAAVFISVALWLSNTQAVSNPGGWNFRDALFMVLTIQTTTGYGTVDFNQWPEVVRMMLLVLMYIGGCAGSTGGGIKVIRFVILFKLLFAEIATSVSPRRVRLLKLDGNVIHRDTAYQVLIFFFVYIFISIVGCILVALLMPEQSLLSSITAVIATINNIGPGLEAVGPTMNFASQSPGAKAVLSILMILGRLELFSLLVLLSPNFWTKG